MAMTPEEKRIAKNEASRRWYAKHKAAIAKTAASGKDDEDPAADIGGSADNAPENAIEQTATPSDNDDGFEEDYDEEKTEADEDELDEDELDEWAAGREDMFREFGAQGYMEED